MFIKAGQFHFNPCLLRKSEFLTGDSTFNYLNVQGEPKQLALSKDALCFTYCQVPIVYQIAKKSSLEVINKNNKVTKFDTTSLDLETSQQIFERTGDIAQIIVNIKESALK